MHTDPIVLDTLHELKAQDERQQIAVAMAMTAMMQQSQLLMAAILAAKANEQAQPVVVRRR
jgi:hypothetical protein